MGFFDIFKKKRKKSDVKLQNLSIQNVEDQVVHQGNVSADVININSKTIEMLHRSFIAFDVETTGLNSEYDRIIELGAVRFIDGQPTEEFSTLVNPQINVPSAATKVNHITNQMISTAPKENEVYPKLLDFLGEASQKKIIMCAHNASFDFRFLISTLKRMGVDASFDYVDTLSLSRKHIKGLTNYKQGTIEKHLGLANDNAHRALSDAKICGKILCNILFKLDEEINEQRKNMEKIKPSEEELEICGYIQKIIRDNGEDVSWIRYRKNSGNYIDVSCLYSFLKFKIAKKGKYIIIDKKSANGLELSQEPCTKSEGGSDFVRVFLESPFDLNILSSFIVSSFKECYKAMNYYLDNGERAKKSAEECIAMLTKIENSEIEGLLSSAEQRIKNNIAIEQEKKRVIEEKQREKEEKKKNKVLAKQKKMPENTNNNESMCSNRKRVGRGIIQLNDDGTIIQEYETVASAVRETGVNSKSIRDAAKGMQKHAGGFCWRYKDEVLKNE
ncbi:MULTISPECIES: exonuclease domain-containing protein [Clostridium]|uniref:3'-5' exoribonuclease n=1 Tax=Clostridium cibarium TaxID=2762247 RepID=A0ABR8PWE8_9CLOT|nr:MULTISPECIES: exonuclease domain-containing protein [Clostridium]MBD7912501.1 3'-5' exoribonuclease [Clostridium cibarium]